jgi:hypothetical protein
MGAPLRQMPSHESPEIVERRIRSLVEEGRILEARDLLAGVGPDVPIDPYLRTVLSPPKARKSDEQDVDRSPEFRWLQEHWAEYDGKWVALVGENLVAACSTLKELLACLDRLQFEREPLIHHLI